MDVRNFDRIIGWIIDCQSNTTSTWSRYRYASFREKDFVTVSKYWNIELRFRLENFPAYKYLKVSFSYSSGHLSDDFTTIVLIASSLPSLKWPIDHNFLLSRGSWGFSLTKFEKEKPVDLLRTVAYKSKVIDRDIRETFYFSNLPLIDHIFNNF